MVVSLWRWYCAERADRGDRGDGPRIGRGMRCRRHEPNDWTGMIALIVLTPNANVCGTANCFYRSVFVLYTTKSTDVFLLEALTTLFTDT